MRTLPRSRALLLVPVVLLALSACKGESGGSKPEAQGGAPKSDRKLKTTLTSKQIDEAWAGLKGNHDFKKHTEMMTAKLGKPMAVNGDQSCWYGYKPAEGPVPDDCEQLCTSATKGSGTMTTDGSGKCWD